MLYLSLTSKPKLQSLGFAVSLAALSATLPAHAATGGPTERVAATATASPRRSASPWSVRRLVGRLGRAYRIARNGGTDPERGATFDNHAAVVVREATATAIRGNDWLKTRFVDHLHRRTEALDKDGKKLFEYEGDYLSGEDTYDEIVMEGTLEMTPRDSLYNVSDESEGGFEAVRDRLAAEFGGADPFNEVYRRSRYKPDGSDSFVEKIPIRMLRLKGKYKGNFSAWHLEYVPPPGSTRPPTRRENLADRYDARKLARRVIARRFALVPEERELLGQELRANGWTVRTKRDRRTGQDLLVAKSPWDAWKRRKVVVEPATDAREGYLSTRWELNRRHAYHREQLGDAYLTIGRPGLLGRLPIWKTATIHWQPGDGPRELRDALRGTAAAGPKAHGDELLRAF